MFNLIFVFYFIVALKKATRFGAKPDFGSTFVNFQHPTNAPGHQSEKNRFTGTSNHFLNRQAGEPGVAKHSVPSNFVGSSLNDKISFQQEDKMKKARMNYVRIQTK